MKISITGSSGFVGKNLIKFLIDKDIKVSKISMREKGWQNNIDLDSKAIIHLAGKAHDTENSSNPDEYYKINRDLSVELFNVFLGSSITDFFYFSSVKAVKDTVEGVLTEKLIPSPKTPYGKSKLEAENYILSSKIPEGKRIFIIRPSMIHGPGNKGNLNMLYKIVKKGIPWPLGAFENKRSFLAIDNLNYLIFKMLQDSNLKSGIYNFSDDSSLSTNELVELISNELGKNGKIWRINKDIITTIAKIGDKIFLPLNSERLKKLTESYVVSNDKIKKALKIKELPVNAKDGFKITIRSFKSI